MHGETSTAQVLTRPVCAGPLPSQIVGGVKNRTLAAGPMAAFMRSTIATRSAVRSARV